MSLLAFDRQRGDVAVGEAGRVARIVPVLHVALAVIAVQSALGGDPDEALRILCQRVHRVLREAAFAGDALEVVVARQRRGVAADPCQQQACDQRDQARGEGRNWTH